MKNAKSFIAQKSVAAFAAAIVMTMLAAPMTAQAATLNMTGGEISGGVALNDGGGVLVQNDLGTAVTVGGTAVISGNYNQSGLPKNLSLNNNSYLAISTETPPEDGMSVGVTKQGNNFVFVQSGAEAWHTQYFFADESNHVIVLDGEKLSVNNGLNRPAPVAELLMFSPPSEVYNSTAKPVTVVPKPLVKGVGEISNIRYNGSATAPTAAGTYAIMADVAASSGAGYTAAANLAVGNWVIEQAEGQFGAPSPINTTYTPTLTLGDLVSELPADYAFTVPLETPLSAGNNQKFAATYTDPSGNYLAASGSIIVNVAKANQSPPVPPTGLPDMTAASTWMWILIALSLSLWCYVGWSYVVSRCNRQNG